MNNHYIIVADHGHLRIFEQRKAPGQTSPSLVEVQSLDFPQGRASYTNNDSDMAGRFQSSSQPGAGAGAPLARGGMSIDERLPMQRETDRRANSDLAESIDEFLLKSPTASWDFAAGPTVHNAVIEKLAPQTRSRLRRSIPKDLVNQPTKQLLAHFHA